MKHRSVEYPKPVEPAELNPNPYAPSAVEEFRSQEPPQVLRRAIPETSLAFTFLRWLFVCGVAATPSFFFGLIASDGRWLAMTAGVLVFVFLYTFADWWTAGSAWRAKSLVRWTLRIGYGTRIFISIAFPVGMFVDLYAGLASITIVHGGAPTERYTMTDLSAFLTTLVQGVLLNIVLMAYMAVVAAIIWTIRSFQGRRE